MNPELPILLAAAGVLLVANGITFRLGTARLWNRWAAKYRSGGLTEAQRRGPLTNIPLGAAMLSASCALLVDMAVARPLLIALAASFGAVALAMWLISPSWAKPTWMRTDVGSD